MTHREIAFEDAIELALIETGGFKKSIATYDAALALFPDDVLAFIQATQAKAWKSLADLYGPDTASALIAALDKELASKTALTVLRHGFKCAGKTFRLAYFQPNTSMNAEALADYQANRLSVYRQVHFSPANPALSVDVVLALNGLPVVTLELKNPLTGQNVEHAKRQYKERNEGEPLFRFKARALVHFAVDPDEAWMTTRLAGKDTLFLPFNKGDRHGAGNPEPPEGKYKTSYLWEEVLARDSLMDILARFLHLKVEERQVPTSKGGVRTIRKEAMIFPRYHQLDAVRRLVADARAKGSGHNYLVQHSAGSGKSNSIAWLAHRLASLHDAKDAKVFDTVVVITDRRVLDKQLQSTVYQFEHKQGVVQRIDENTQQLAKALGGGVPIVISTIQKFPFISQAINTLGKKGESVAISTVGRRFAVIVDEAHSSQSGETAAELRRILNKDGIETAIAEQLSDLEDEPLSEEAKKALLAEMLKRPRQPNISFFAFTATPKFKTLAAFNEPGPDGRPPFHLYSMRQAIEEGFILDVLANYTTYKTYYGLIKKIEADPQVPRREAAKALARCMSLHPYNIAQKVEVIVEHFRTSTKHKIGGRAKAMVVTGSRLHAVRYKLAFDKYVKEKGYTGIRSLVAFSAPASRLPRSA
jgi:type I restriction enzyme R subunit